MNGLTSQAIQTAGVVTLSLEPDCAVLLDQTALPREVRYTRITTPDQMVHAIRTMVVRGAPAIGVAGAFGLVLGAREHGQTFQADLPRFLEAVKGDAQRLEAARPTAVNLNWAIARMLTVLNTQADQNITPEALVRQLEAEAQAIYEEDLAMCKAIGRHGAALVPRGAAILTHCNAGALATAGYGTALGVIRAAFDEDRSITVYADETRPRLQGARLTTWEMLQEGIPVTLITDNMSAWLMKQGKVNMVIVGADRIAANGDAANKIGTYLLALAAKAHNIPFYVAAPSSTIDLAMETGDAIPIEERPEEEVHWIHNESICPEGVGFYNPAFDVTPAELITAIITEKGVFRPPYDFKTP